MLDNASALEEYQTILFPTTTRSATVWPVFKDCVVAPVGAEIGFPETSQIHVFALKVAVS